MKESRKGIVMLKRGQEGPHKKDDIGPKPFMLERHTAQIPAGFRQTHARSRICSNNERKMKCERCDNTTVFIVPFLQLLSSVGVAFDRRDGGANSGGPFLAGDFSLSRRCAFAYQI